MPEEPQGYVSKDNHTQGHDYYKMWSQNGSGVSCCSDQDCRATQFKYDKLHNLLVMIEGKYCKVDTTKILKDAYYPDSYAHICTEMPNPGQDPCSLRVYCIVLPNIF